MCRFRVAQTRPVKWLLIESKKALQPSALSVADRAPLRAVRFAVLALTWQSGVWRIRAWRLSVGLGGPSLP